MTKDELLKLVTVLQAELEATNRQVEVLSDALAESRRDIDAMIALARADERNRTWTQEHWTDYERSIAAAEREACAKLCDEIAIDMWKLYKGRPPYKGDEEGRASDFTQGRSAGADDCAEAIRRRTDAA